MIVEIGPIFVIGRGPASTTIRVHSDIFSKIRVHVSVPLVVFVFLIDEFMKRIHLQKENDALPIRPMYELMTPSKGIWSAAS